mmetsp:Transcript_76964/g.243216  ORF Transcript_76964/g.243216 Transcript_76964/m.243216 type:complete len:289 (-) Transcript_76964:93-959(-)
MPGLPAGSSSGQASGSSSGSPTPDLRLPAAASPCLEGRAPPKAPRQPVLPTSCAQQQACNSSILRRAAATHARISRSTAALEVVSRSCWHRSPTAQRVILVSALEPGPETAASEATCAAARAGRGAATLEVARAASLPANAGDVGCERRGAMMASSSSGTAGSSDTSASSLGHLSADASNTTGSSDVSAGAGGLLTSRVSTGTSTGMRSGLAAPPPPRLGDGGNEPGICGASSSGASAAASSRGQTIRRVGPEGQSAPVVVDIGDDTMNGCRTLRDRTKGLIVTVMVE